MSIKKILVTGANGQLGWGITQLAASYPMYEFIFADRSMFDLSKPELFESLIQQRSPQATATMQISPRALQAPSLPDLHC